MRSQPAIPAPLLCQSIALKNQCLFFSSNMLMADPGRRYPGIYFLRWVAGSLVVAPRVPATADKRLRRFETSVERVVYLLDPLRSISKVQSQTERLYQSQQRVFTVFFLVLRLLVVEENKVFLRCDDVVDHKGGFPKSVLAGDKQWFSITETCDWCSHFIAIAVSDQKSDACSLVRRFWQTAAVQGHLTLY